MSDIEIKIDQGVLRGKECRDFLGCAYYSFQGIPYAKPPLGTLRFQNPQGWEAWTGVRDATEERPGCYSVDFFTGNASGDEDCLYLNVYTPEVTTESSRLKPVMVFIHAGGFTAGSGGTQLYGPDYLISQSIVLVTLNYRVGALGFLSLEEDAPGNVGLMDQIMALNWVQKNICYFGGDASNITLFGHSAGGASVHYLLLSAKSQGLFHKVIIQSGTVLDAWAKGQKLNGVKLCDFLGVTSNNKEMLEALQQASLEDILAAQLSMKDSLIPNLRRPFGPIIQSSSIQEAFLTEDPLDIILKGNYNKDIPIMLGYTSREGILFDFMYTDAKQYDLETSIPNFMNLEKGSPLSMKIVNKIKQFYFGEKKEIGGDELYQLQTDNLFFRGIHQSAKYHSQINRKPVYLYRFSMESDLNTMKLLFKKDNIGACHGDDVFHLFKSSLFPYDVRHCSKEYNGILKMIRIWTNFAKFGCPNGLKREGVVDVEWKPVTNECMNFMDINFVLTPGVNPDKERMEFWDKIFQIKSCSRKY